MNCYKKIYIYSNTVLYHFSFFVNSTFDFEKNKLNDAVSIETKCQVSDASEQVTN